MTRRARTVTRSRERLTMNDIDPKVSCWDLNQCFCEPQKNLAHCHHDKCILLASTSCVLLGTHWHSQPWLYHAPSKSWPTPTPTDALDWPGCVAYADRGLGLAAPTRACVGGRGVVKERGFLGGGRVESNADLQSSTYSLYSSALISLSDSRCTRCGGRKKLSTSTEFQSSSFIAGSFGMPKGVLLLSRCSRSPSGLHVVLRVEPPLLTGLLQCKDSVPLRLGARRRLEARALRERSLSCGKTTAKSPRVW